MPGFGRRLHAPGGRHGNADAVTDERNGLAIEAPERSRLDEAIAVRITGVPPGDCVTLRATLVDDEGVEWSAHATLAADADGVVDLTARAPETGDWGEAAPMACCWAMAADADARTASLAEQPEIDVRFEATVVGDDARAEPRRTERTITREVADPYIAAHEVDAEGLVGTWYEPPGAGPHPGVVSLHGSAGPGSHRTERLLATHGFATLALSYTGDDPVLPDRIRRVRLPYVEDALDWFGARPAVADGSLGLFGVSRGAELALQIGARADAVGPVISYSGSGVRYDTPMGEPAWVDASGDPVPHIEGVGEPERTDDGAVVTRPVLERGLDRADADALDAATIPVEDIDGPVLLVSGGDDQVWPARRLSAIAADRLAAADREAPFSHLTHDDVGHLIGVPYVPLGNMDGGGTASATATFGPEAWARTLEMLEQGLPIPAE